MKADLHIHSTVSDGSDTMEEIVEKAVRKGLDAIAITDHDTVSHLARLPRDPRIMVLGGIEISAFDPATGVKVHVLGYGLIRVAHVEALVAPLRERRHRNSLKQIALLKENGYTVDIASLKLADGQYIYKQHIMEHLVNTGQADALHGKLYQRIFKHGGFCAFDIDYVAASAAVAAIHQAGGKAVLAHPGQQQNFYLLSQLPFDGVEYYHPENNLADLEQILEYQGDCNKALFLTGGSDYHGRYNDIPVEIGDYIACESGVQSLC